MDGKNKGKRIGFGILFVAACFAAMYILTEFHGDLLMVSVAAVLLMISAFLFLNAVFADKAKQWAPEEEVKELPSKDAGAFQSQVVKHMKEMEAGQKELISVLKNQNTLLQTQIENLEHEIYMLSEKQISQTKSVIKFNKENARQLAISERETLEYVMMELKKAIEENAVPVESAEASADAAFVEEVAIAVPELEEVAEEELFTVSELAGDDEEIIPEFPTEELQSVAEEIAVEEPLVEEAAQEEMEIPDMPEDIDLSQLFDIPEMDEVLAEVALEDIPAIEEPMESASIEEQPVEEPKPAQTADPLAGLSGDPNAMMTPEDIAKLLEAMGQ